MAFAVTDILKAFAREELAVYAAVQWPEFVLARHIKLLVDALQDVEAARCKRLIISLPPRNGKSLTCSQLFPAWYLGRNPDNYVISTTYGEDLAVDFGRQVRNYVNSPQHREIFPSCVLSDDSASAHRFTIRGHQGIYYAVGRGGPITGRGAHLLLIDDPIKDDIEAQSEIVRQQLHTWFQAVARTRLMPNAAIVIITTRWHVNDLPGWVLENQASEGWRVITLPAIAEGGDDPLGRAEGEALWPERFPLDYLVTTRDGMEARLWEALYQQKPSIGGGYMFDASWMETYTPKSVDSRGRGMNKYILVDPANSKKKTSDMTSMWVVGLNADKNYYVLDMVHDRLNVHERVKTAFDLHRRYRPFALGWEQMGLQSDLDHLKRKMDDENYHFTVTELKSTVPKKIRIEALQPIFRNRRVWFPPEIIKNDHEGRPHDLVKEFKHQELAKYPAVKHEDRLDALAWIVSTKFAVTWPELEDDETSSLDRRGNVRHSARRGSAWAN